GGGRGRLVTGGSGGRAGGVPAPSPVQAGPRRGAEQRQGQQGDGIEHEADDVAGDGVAEEVTGDVRVTAVRVGGHVVGGGQCVVVHLQDRGEPDGEVQRRAEHHREQPCLGSGRPAGGGGGRADRGGPDRGRPPRWQEGDDPDGGGGGQGDKDPGSAAGQRGGERPPQHGVPVVTEAGRGEPERNVTSEGEREQDREHVRAVGGRGGVGGGDPDHGADRG